jgi:DNA-binding CsgD family transcriptional regulator
MAQISQVDLDQIIKLNRLTREINSVDELRSEMLRQMEAIFNASSGMFLLRPKGCSIATFDRHVEHGLPEDFLTVASYPALLLDPFARYFLKQPGIELQPEVRTGDELVPYDELMKMSFYWKYMHPFDMHHMLRMELVVNNQSIGTVGLFRPMNAPNFSEAENTKATLIISALANALDRELQKETYREDFSILEKSSSSMSQVGLLILDENLNPVYCDANARERCSALSAHDEKISTGSFLPSALMEPIRNFRQRLQKDARTDEAEETFALSDDHNALITNVNLRAQKTVHGGWRIVVYLMPDQQQLCPAKRLHELGLTKCEGGIVQLVVGGLKNREIAEKLSISINTVQTHLNTIFRKLNVCNRSELIIKVTTPLSTASSYKIQ